jgi:hypothetical protein
MSPGIGFRFFQAHRETIRWHFIVKWEVIAGIRRSGASIQLGASISCVAMPTGPPWFSAHGAKRPVGRLKNDRVCCYGIDIEVIASVFLASAVPMAPFSALLN